jgi:hypothetical protein
MAKGWFRRKKEKLVYCWYNANGNERSKVVGPDTMTDGEGWLEVGRLGLYGVVNKPDPAKFGEVLHHYLAYGKKKTGEDKAGSTRQTDSRNARVYLQPMWGDRIAKDVEPLEIQEWIDSLSKGLRAKVRNLMSAVYKHGQKFGKIPRSEESNPMKWVSATTVSDYEAISLTPEEAFAILERIHDPLVRVLVILVAVTAIRIGEALGLMWSDVDWKKLKINIRRDWVDGELGRPKSRASKAPVEMHETLAAVLQAWRQETPYNDPVVVQRMLRQSHVDMTMHYVHNSHKARNAQAQFIERFLPDGGTVSDVEGPRDEKRAPVRVQ